MVVVRSPHAHGILRGIDADEARAIPGVLGVYTGADLAAAGIRPLACGASLTNADGSPMRKPPRPALASDKVRYRRRSGGGGRGGDRGAGEARGGDRGARHRAAARRDDARGGGRTGAPLLHDEAPGNLAVEFHYGDAEKSLPPSRARRMSRG